MALAYGDLKFSNRSQKENSCPETMCAIELGIRCAQNVYGIAADPQPDWSFDKLLSELNNSITLKSPSPFTKTEPRYLKASKEKHGVVMHVSNCLLQRFISLPLISDDSEDGITRHPQQQVMGKAGAAEAVINELGNGLRLNVMEEVRSKISSLQTALAHETEKVVSLITITDKDRELQHERDRKLDLQYQCTLAESLDDHLTTLQRDHERVSQLEERRIQDDMARAREKAMQEEKIRQERIKAEEAKLKAEIAEHAKTAALEAEKKAAEEAAAKIASDTLCAAHNEVRNIIRASKNALELEKRRQQIYEELSTKNKALKESTGQDYHSRGHSMGRLIRTISATVENIRTRAEELDKLINSPECPQSISIQLFAEKIVSNCANQRSSNAIFAACRVVVFVTSKIPIAMDILIAELNRVCIYTAPKHISYAEEAFITKDEYFKAIGYKEVDGKIESIDDYVERLSCYMKLYGALVQTEVGGFQNLHGLEEGWAWLARFLNALPANLFTATALDSFLGMAGYALYCRYKNQFEKLLSIISRDFLNALQEGGSGRAKISQVKMSIQTYIESQQYKKEPQGLQLRSHLDSHYFV